MVIDKSHASSASRFGKVSALSVVLGWLQHWW